MQAGLLAATQRGVLVLDAAVCEDARESKLCREPTESQEVASAWENGDDARDARDARDAPINASARR